MCGSIRNTPSGAPTRDGFAPLALRFFRQSDSIDANRRRDQPRAMLCVIAGIVFAAAMLTKVPLGAAPPLNQITLPEGPLPPHETIPENPQALEAIKRTLAGDTTVETGNPMLHDVLRICGETSERRTAEWPQRIAKRTDSWDVESPFQPSVDASPSPRSNAITQRHRAAELLLRVGRLIDKIDPADENRQRLVNQMRREAVRLLVETVDSQENPLPSSDSNPMHSVEPVPAAPAGTFPTRTE